MARQIPFAGFVKKLTVGRVIVAVVCGALGFGIGVVKDWSEVKGARVDLAREVETYRADYEVRMARLAYDAVATYLSEEDRGRYQQRLDYVASPDRGLFVIHGDTPSSVVDGLFDGIDLWTHKGMNAVGLNYPNRQDRRRKIPEHPPVRKGEAIRRTIDGIIGISHYPRHVEKIEEVQELSAEFGVMRIVTERLLAASDKPSAG